MPYNHLGKRPFVAIIDGVAGCISNLCICSLLVSLEFGGVTP